MASLAGDVAVGRGATDDKGPVYLVVKTADAFLTQEEHALADILASLHRPDGTVAVDGFYDGIPPVSAERRAEIAAIPFDEADFLAGSGSASGTARRVSRRS